MSICSSLILELIKFRDIEGGREMEGESEIEREREIQKEKKTQFYGVALRLILYLFLSVQNYKSFY